MKPALSTPETDETTTANSVIQYRVSSIAGVGLSVMVAIIPGV